MDGLFVSFKTQEEEAMTNLQVASVGRYLVPGAGRVCTF